MLRVQTRRSDGKFMKKQKPIRTVTAIVSGHYEYTLFDCNPLCAGPIRPSDSRGYAAGNNQYEAEFGDAAEAKCNVERST